MDRLLQRNCTRDEFLLLFSKLLSERFPTYRFEFTGETTIRSRRPDGKEATSYLDNLWIGYSSSEEGRRELIERHIRIVADLHREENPLSREQVIAMVKDSEYVAMLKGPTETVKRHLVGDLWIVYAEDLPERVRSLSRERMEAAGIMEAELHSLALQNLKRVMPETERHGDGPWYLLSAGADYVASLLLFESLWEALADDEQGEIIAVAPSRDVVLYTHASSNEGIDAIRRHATEIVQSGSYVISETLLRRVDGKWEVFNAN